MYRTDHVGSLVRPTRLLDAREAFKANGMDLEELRKVEDEAILEVFRVPKDVGIDVFTDGEFRRQSYTTDQYEAVEGFASEYPKVEQTRPHATSVCLAEPRKYA